MHHPRTSWPVATRVQHIIAFEEARRRYPRLSARRFAALAELPYSTFARWWAAYRRFGPRGFKDRSRRPHHCPRALPGSVLDVIRQAHRESALGVRRLHAALIETSRITCSPSTVYRVLRRAGALVRRPRRPKPVWTRYARAFPGERAQMDLKYLPERRFQLTLIDDCSRIVAGTVLTGRTTAAVCSALPGLLDALPFAVHCLQTDNGSEFGRDLSRLLARRGIRHVRIRPRTPRLNGKVERVQRTIQEELWDGVVVGSIEAWEHQLQQYLRHYNTRRLHSALGSQPPLRYALERLPRQARISHMS
jgi:transposase InsO family protein